MVKFPTSLRPLAAVASCVALLLSMSPARAQLVEDAPLRIRLIGHPIWHEPGDPLHVKLRITNVGPEEISGFGIRIGLYSRVQSRSALHDSFDALPGQDLYVVSRPYRSISLEPGESTRIVIEDAVETLGGLAAATDGGVFPLTLTVFDLRTPTVFLDSVTTPLIFYPESPVDPLDIVPIFALEDEPSQGPDGAFVVPAGENQAPLQQAVRPGGWLISLLDALKLAADPPAPEPSPEPDKGKKKNKRRKHRHPPPPPDPPLHVGISPDPRLLEELAALADGFRTSDGGEFQAESPQAETAAAAVDALRALLRLDNVEALLTPYASPDLPALAELPDLLAHITEGEQVSKNVLGIEGERGWFFPPGGALDAGSLEDLQLGDRARRIASVSATSLIPPIDPDAAGCPEELLTFACPATFVTATGRSHGFVSDVGVEERLSSLPGAGGNDRLALQQFFAETSMIREEQPGIAERVIQATIPAAWDPPARLSRLLVDGLRSAPWLRTRTPSEGLRSEHEAVERQLIPEIQPVDAEVAAFYDDDLQNARSLVDSYEEIATDELDRIQRLKRNLLLAQSTAPEDLDAALAYVGSSEEEVTTELGKIRIIGANDVTLTSSRGRFQFVLANDTGYPVRVAVELEAQGQLAVDPDVLDRLSTTYGPGNHPLTVAATARASGKFQVFIRVETPESRHLIAEKELDVRSTVFNRIALSITVGAALFLILFYVWRAIRTRRNGGSEADAA